MPPPGSLATRARFLEFARRLIPELPAGTVLVPAQRGARDAAPRALAPAPVAPRVSRARALAAPAPVLALAAGPSAADTEAEPTVDPSTARDASPWFDWRRARGSTDPPGAESDAPAEEQSDPPEAEAEAAAAAAAGPRAFPWFRSIEG
jgi:hypothetical protein